MQEEVISTYPRKIGRKTAISRVFHWGKTLGTFLPLTVVLLYLISPITIVLCEKIFHNLYIKLSALDAPPLVNDQSSGISRPPWTFDGMTTGKFRSEFESWFAKKIPFRSAVIRLYNQIFYSFFSASPKTLFDPFRITFGKSDHVYFSSLITEGYCKTPPLNTPSALRIWAHDIKTLAIFFEKRRQQFFYMISPSNVSYYADSFPINYAISPPCRPQEYIPLEKIFNPSKINFIDAHEVVMKAKPIYGDRLFPYAGFHWGMLGATLAVENFIHKLRDSLHQDLPELRFNLNLQPKQETDTELLKIANLLWPKVHHIPSEVNIIYPDLGNKKPLKLAIVGDSMSINFINSLIQTKLFDQIDFYYYYHRHIRSIKNDPLFPISDEKNKYEALLSADVVILEENEVIRGSHHSGLLFQSLFGFCSPVN